MDKPANFGELLRSKEKYAPLLKHAYYPLRLSYFLEKDKFFLARDLYITGLEHLPKDKPCLILPNHQAFADVAVLYMALQENEISANWIIRADLPDLLTKIGCIKVYRPLDMRRLKKEGKLKGGVKEEFQTLNEEAKDRILYLCAQREAIVCFPEGTVNRDGLGRFNFELVKNASYEAYENKKAEVLVIPTRISYYDYGNHIPRVPIKIAVVEFTKPRSIDDLTKNEFDDFVRERLEKRLAA